MASIFFNEIQNSDAYVTSKPEEVCSANELCNYEDLGDSLAAHDEPFEDPLLNCIVLSDDDNNSDDLCILEDLNSSVRDSGGKMAQNDYKKKKKARRKRKKYKSESTNKSEDESEKLISLENFQNLNDTENNKRRKGNFKKTNEGLDRDKNSLILDRSINETSCDAVSQVLETVSENEDEIDESSNISVPVFEILLLAWKIEIDKQEAVEKSKHQKKCCCLGLFNEVTSDKGSNLKKYNNRIVRYACCNFRKALVEKYA